MPNRSCCRTLVLASLAGTALGATAAARAQTAYRGEVHSITPSSITYRGVTYPVISGGADDQALIYQNSTGPLYYLANAGVSPYQLMDDVSYTPGPGAGAGRLINTVKIGFVTTAASPTNLDVELTVWDTEFAGTPANQTQVGAPVILNYPAPSGGWPAAVSAWTSEVNIATLPGGGIPASADDQVLVRYRMLQAGTTTPHAHATPLFAMGAAAPGAPPTVGNSRASFYYDANNDGQFANTEQYILTGFTAASNLYLELQSDVPPLFTGACCAANGTCTTVSPSSCSTSGGIYRGNNVTCAAANCNATGACCQLDGTCSVANEASCKSTNGLYRGNAAACGSANCPTSYAYTGAPVSIDDAVGTNCGAQVLAQISVTDSFTVSAADASMLVTHTWQGDLQMWLKHVQTGTTVRIVNQPSNGGGGFGADDFGSSPLAGDLFRLVDSAADFYLPARGQQRRRPRPLPVEAREPAGRLQWREQRRPVAAARPGLRGGRRRGHPVLGPLPPASRRRRLLRQLRRQHHGPRGERGRLHLLPAEVRGQRRLRQLRRQHHAARRQRG